MSIRPRSSKMGGASYIPLSNVPPPPRIDSPPASAYLSPDGHRLANVDEESVGEHFSYSTTLRKHKRRKTWRERMRDGVRSVRGAIGWVVRSGGGGKGGYEAVG